MTSCHRETLRLKLTQSPFSFSQRGSWKDLGQEGLGENSVTRSPINIEGPVRRHEWMDGFY